MTPTTEVNLPAMKARDIRKCSSCGKGVSQGNLIFYVVTVEQWVLNPRGIQQTHGLEQFFGGGQAGAALASIMGSDPDIANQTCKTKLFMCLACSTEEHRPILLLEKETS